MCCLWNRGRDIKGTFCDFSGLSKLTDCPAKTDLLPKDVGKDGSGHLKDARLGSSSSGTTCKAWEGEPITKSAGQKFACSSGSTPFAGTAPLDGLALTSRLPQVDVTS